MATMFLSSPAESERLGRIVKVGPRPTAIRIRSEVVWAAVHWAGQSVLCSGGHCPLCDLGIGLKAAGWAAVDVSGGQRRLWQLSHADGALLRRVGEYESEQPPIGLALTVHRQGKNKPQSITRLRVDLSLTVVGHDIVVQEVLALHRIHCPLEHVQSGAYLGIVREVAAIAASHWRGAT